MHNSSHTHTRIRILAGCWCSPQTNQDSLFLSLPTWRFFLLHLENIVEKGAIKKKLSNLFTRGLLGMCVCICVLSFHLKSILNLAYRCSTDDATPVSFFFIFFLSSSLSNYQKNGWTTSWWQPYSSLLFFFVMLMSL